MVSTLFSVASLFDGISDYFTENGSNFDSGDTIDRSVLFLIYYLSADGSTNAL